MKKRIVVGLSGVIFILALGIYQVKYSSTTKIELSPIPYGKNFAFTITDDPDGTSLPKIKPIYDLLLEYGVKSTIAVWVTESLRSDGVPDQVGQFDYSAEYVYDYVLVLDAGDLIRSKSPLHIEIFSIEDTKSL